MQTVASETLVVKWFNPIIVKHQSGPWHRFSYQLWRPQGPLTLTRPTHSISRPSAPYQKGSTVSSESTGLSVLLVEIPVLSQDLQRLADLPPGWQWRLCLQMSVEARPPGLHATQTGSGMQSHIYSWAQCNFISIILWASCLRGRNVCLQTTRRATCSTQRLWALQKQWCSMIFIYFCCFILIVNRKWDIKL